MAVLVFVDILANPWKQNLFFSGPSFYVYYLLFVISCIFSQVLQICYSTKLFNGTSNSLSVTFFSNELNCTINEEWQQKATSFRLQKETSCCIYF